MTIEAKLVTLEDWKATPEHTLEVTAGRFHVWIQARPSYCDRGQWSVSIEEIEPPWEIDDADKFPRYYMYLGRCLAEMTDWLNWRLYKHRGISEVPNLTWLEQQFPKFG